MTRRIGWIGLLVALLPAGGVAGQTTHQHKDTGNYVLKRAHAHVESIRDELMRNRNDYGGHRREAIAHLSQALDDLDRALWIEDPPHP